MNQGLQASSIDIAEVRRRLPMALVCAREGVEMKKAGTWLVGLCPFHEERSPSFQIGNQRPDRATCRGCGWKGDIIDFWEKKRGVEKGVALRELGELAGVLPVGSAEAARVQWTNPRARAGTGAVVRKAVQPGEKPLLPRMRGLREEEIVKLAELRGLSVEGVRVAAMTFRRVGFCLWPQYLRKAEQRWGTPCDAHWWRCELGRGRLRAGDAGLPAECVPVPCYPSWVVTDDSRHVAQYRRLDGEMYVPRGEEGKPMKAWTKGSPTWPLGAAEMGGRKCVLLVEGGADMLAAYHFLWGYRMLEKVAVVCMLGGSNRIAEEALPYFRRCRVRIMMDEDPEKVMRTKRGDGTEAVKKQRAGMEAAARWTEQLTEAGAVVVTFSLEGLLRADGKVVKDLNDLALCSAETLEEEGIEEAFTEWEF